MLAKHSAYLAWLLDPDGPLTDCWLMRLLMRDALPDRPSMGKPTLSEGTLLLIQEYGRFEALRRQAIEDSGEYVHWLASEAANRLRPLIGPEMEWQKIPYGRYTEFLYGRRDWSIEGCRYGIGFGAEKVGQGVLPEMRFWIGLFLPEPKDKGKLPRHLKLAELLGDTLVRGWPLGDVEREEAWALFDYRDFPKTGAEPDKWAEQVLDDIVKLGESYAPLLPLGTADAMPERRPSRAKS